MIYRDSDGQPWFDHNELQHFAMNYMDTVLRAEKNCTMPSVQEFYVAWMEKYGAVQLSLSEFFAP